MTKTISITIEVYDDTNVSEIENIVGEALNDKGIDCSYDVNELVEVEM